MNTLSLKDEKILWAVHPGHHYRYCHRTARRETGIQRAQSAK